MSLEDQLLEDDNPREDGSTAGIKLEEISGEGEQSGEGNQTTNKREIVAKPPTVKKTVKPKAVAQNKKNESHHLEFEIQSPQCCPKETTSSGEKDSSCQIASNRQTLRQTDWFNCSLPHFWEKGFDNRKSAMGRPPTQNAN